MSIYGAECVLAPFTFMISFSIHHNVMWKMISAPLWQLKQTFREVK